MARWVGNLPRHVSSPIMSGLKHDVGEDEDYDFKFDEMKKTTTSELIDLMRANVPKVDTLYDQVPCLFS